MDQVNCKKCNKLKQRMYLKSKGKNLTYVDEKGDKWRSYNICPECYLDYRKKYNREVCGHKNLHEFDCKTCNKHLMQTKYDQIFCSIECYYKSSNYQEYRAKTKSKGYKYTKECFNCHKTFGCATKKTEYCSSKCYWAVNKKPPVVKESKNVIEHTKACEHCGDEFKTLSKRQKYCSKSCGVNAWQKIHGRSKRSNSPKAKASRKQAKKNREMLLIQRLPKWADRPAIREFYAACPEGMYVDHIIPLKGLNVSGLHVHWNFQYLDRMSNSIKNNNFDGTYDNEGWRIFLSPEKSAVDK